MSDNPQNTPESELPSQYGEGVGVADGVEQTLEAQEAQHASPTIVTFLVALLTVLAFWSGSQFIQGSQDFDPMVYNPYRKLSATPVAPPTLAQIGEKVFVKNCATCHQANGAGLVGTFPTLHGTQWVVGDKDRVLNILLSGLEGPIEIEGTTYNSNMPAWGDVLKDKQIAAVLTYVRTNAQWGNNASEITEQEVASARSAYGVRPQAWTVETLLAEFPNAQ